MTKSRAKIDPSLEQELQEFFSCTLAEKAAAGLNEKAVVALYVDGVPIYFARRSGTNRLHKKAPAEPDVHFWLRLSTTRQLMELAKKPKTNMAHMGIAVFDAILSRDEERKIRFRVDSGFLSLWSKGYFSVLKAGGPEVASYMARLGLNSAAQIKVLLKKMRG